MTILPYASAASIVLILLSLLRAYRRTAAPSSNVPKGEPSNEARNAARRKIVADADRIYALENELARLAEGTGSGISDDRARERAEQVRDEVARLRASSVAACVEYNLPKRVTLGRQSTRHVQTASLLGKD